jgi:tetratricopeptide (TPR) repeat protein
MAKYKYAEAINYFTNAIQLNPKYALAYLERGLAHQLQTHYDEAIIDYSQVIQLNQATPEHRADAHSKRGFVFQIKKKFAEAIYDYLQALHLDKNNHIANIHFKSLINYNTRYNLDPYKLFDLFKKLPAIEQIQVLKNCLDKKTMLGNWFFVKEKAIGVSFLHFNMKTKHHSSLKKDVEQQIFNLQKPILFWSYLVGPELGKNETLPLDVIRVITSFYLEVTTFNSAFIQQQNKNPHSILSLSMFRNNTKLDSDIQNTNNHANQLSYS